MNVYERYQQQIITTMTRGDMLIKLYDETLKQLDIARVAIAARKPDAMDKAINKACEILRYLRSTLDYRFPVSYNLAKLYEFFDAQLVMVSVKKDAALLKEVEELVRDLRNTFDQCDKMDRASRSGHATGNVV